MIHPLKRLALFSSLSAETIAKLTKPFPEVHFKQGSLLAKQGRKDIRLHVVTEGRIRIFSRGKSGKKVTLGICDAPSILGELEIWQECAYLASVEAVEPCTAYSLDRDAFLRLLHSNHQVCINLVKILAAIALQDAMDARLRAFGNAIHLVANTLCGFADRYGEEKRYGVLINKAVNKAEIADLLGLNRRSVIRSFTELEKRKLIDSSGKQLVVADLGALRRLAGEPFVAEEE